MVGQEQLMSMLEAFNANKIQLYLRLRELGPPGAEILPCKLESLRAQ